MTRFSLVSMAAATANGAMIGTNMRLLLFRNHGESAHALATWLFESGHSVHGCRDAAEATDACERESFEAILILPGKRIESDIEFCKWLRSRPGGLGVAIIIVAVSADPMAIPAFIDAGADDYIVPPIGQSSTLTRINIAVRRRKNRRAGQMNGNAEFSPWLESRPRGFVVVDPRCQNPVANERAEDLTGRGPGVLTSEMAYDSAPNRVQPVHSVLDQGRKANGRSSSPVEVLDGPACAAPSPEGFTPSAVMNESGDLRIAGHKAANGMRDDEYLHPASEWLHFALKAAKLRIWTWDLVTGVFSTSDDIEIRIGKNNGRHTFTYQDFLATVHPEDRKRVDANVRATLTGGTNHVSDYRMVTPRGGIAWIEEIGQLERAVDGRPLRMIGISQDITARKSVQDVLREGEERFRGAFEHAGTAMMLISVDGRFLRANPAACRFFGYDESELLKRTFQELTHPDDLEADLENVRRVLSGEIESFQMEKRYLKSDGSVIWGHLSVTLVHTALGAPNYFVSQVQDITERKRAEAALETAYIEMNRVVSSVSNCIYSAELTNDGAYRYQYLSPVAEKLLGRPASFFIEDPSRWRDVIHGDDLDLVLRAMDRFTSSDDDEVITELRIVKPDGSIRWMHDRVAVARGNGVIRLDGVLTDVTERKAIETEMAHRALHDALTGLPNRTLFLDRLSHALVRRRQRAESVGVLFLDLDNFKMVNDGLGHEAGDELLAIVARKLAGHSRAEDTVARIGGDEFVVLVEDLNSAADATLIAERLIAALAEPISISGRHVYTGLSIGIALSGDALCHPNEILRNADAALYRAKASGRNRYVVFDAGMSFDSLARLELETDLRHALGAGDGLVLYYQPVFELASQRVVGCEVLARWQHPTRGLLNPDSFIPLAEETGLIAPLEQWVLGEACRQVREWHASFALAERMCVSVNLSPGRCREPGVVQQVSTVLKRTGLDPAWLTLEITERVLVDEDAHVTLNALKDLGIRLAIDDFGTGYSSLGYLSRIGADALKIDRQFVAGMMKSTREAAIVEAVLALGRSLGLSVTAEGIETRAQLLELRRLGCDLGQGYFLGRPVSASDFCQHLKHAAEPALPGPSVRSMLVD